LRGKYEASLWKNRQQQDSTVAREGMADASVARGRAKTLPSPELCILAPVEALSGKARRRRSSSRVARFSQSERFEILLGV